MVEPEHNGHGRMSEQPELANVQRTEHDGVYALAVAGELDISNVRTLRDAAALVPNDALGLVVDLTETTFVDSATVGLLFELKHNLERRAQVLRVVCEPGSPAERVLSMTSFDESLRGEPTLQDAIEAIRREVPLNP
jgi:anti-anti-sigma factor